MIPPSTSTQSPHHFWLCNVSSIFGASISISMLLVETQNLQKTIQFTRIYSMFWIRFSILVEGCHKWVISGYQSLIGDIWCMMLEWLQPAQIIIHPKSDLLAPPDSPLCPFYDPSFWWPQAPKVAVFGPDHCDHQAESNVQAYFPKIAIKWFVNIIFRELMATQF